MNRNFFSTLKFSFFQLAFFFILLTFGADALKLAVQGDDNNYCIILDSPEITGSITYNGKGGAINMTTFSVSDGSAIVDKNDSSCGAIQRITFKFTPLINGMAAEKDRKWNITLEFNKVENRSYALTDYSLGVTFFKAQGANKRDHIYVKNGTAEWGAHLESQQSKYPNGFTCSENRLTLSDSSSLNFLYLKLVAFDKNVKDAFRDGQIFEDCPLDVRTSDLVPIIVGALLAGLVVLVLIAYLIGRARAKRQGYTSV